MFTSQKVSLSALKAMLPALAFALAALPPALHAQTETVLYSFGSDAYTDAIQPAVGLVRDAKGNLYGTTLSGGSPNAWAGAVFELIPAADGGAWTEKVLYNFGATGKDAANPNASLVLDAKGNLYGTTLSGGTNGKAKGDGTVFELTPAAGGGWTEKVLYNFGATAADGYNPDASLIFDTKGNLYGTTYGGGANGSGTVFELTPAAGGGWTEKVLHSFGATSTDGTYPRASLVLDGKGNLYGTTLDGGEGYGTVFELTPAANGGWTEKVLYSFGATATDGQSPIASLIFDAAKVNLYGATQSGGKGGWDGTIGFGTVFELAPTADGGWTEKVLYNFGATKTDGAIPLAGLVFDAQGSLYGTTAFGGTYLHYGSVFELTPEAGGAWTEKLLHSFPIANGKDGIYPYAGLIFDPAGNLYSTNTEGGAYGNGAAFEILATTVATPELSPAAGPFLAAQTVQITDGTPGATIYYTINGETPTTSSPEYTKPIDVAASETVKAIATAKGLTESGAASAAYIIGEAAETPTFSLAAGTYKSAQSVKLADATPGATIYYTTNDTTPTAASTRYTGPIAVAATEDIKAIAIAPGYSQSAIATREFLIDPPAATPILSPPAGTYAPGQPIKITDATPGATIYYTTNEATPTAASTRYTGPVALAATEYIKAIAIAPGYSESAVAISAFVIDPLAATPVFSPPAGNYAPGQPIKITDATPGATIYYTTNEATPTAASTRYTGPVALAATEFIKAIAIAPSHSPSAVAIGAFYIEPPTNTPAFFSSVNTYPNAEGINIVDTTTGATIYYTVNGATPTTASTKFTSTIIVSGTETIQAIAVAPGRSQSAIATLKIVFP